MTVTRTPIAGESTKETVKTIAQGMPGDAGVTAVTMLACFLFYMRGCGRSARPVFPAPSDFFRKAGHLQEKPARGMRRDRGVAAV